MAEGALDAFRDSLKADAPSTGLSAPLAALWWAGKGNWHRAHAIVQDADGDQAAWVHAYLHRLEGDEGNAAFWYRHAGRPIAAGALAEEWDAIAASLSLLMP